MYQRNSALRLRVEPVENLDSAMSILRRLSGTPLSAKPSVEKVRGESPLD